MGVRLMKLYSSSPSPYACFGVVCIHLVVVVML